MEKLKSKKTKKTEKMFKTNTKCGSNIVLKKQRTFIKSKTGIKKFKIKGGNYDYSFNQNVIRLFSRIISDVITIIQKRTNVQFFGFINKLFDTFKKTFESIENNLNKNNDIKIYLTSRIQELVAKTERNRVYLHILLANKKVLLSSLPELLQEDTTRNFILQKVDEKINSMTNPIRRGGKSSRKRGGQVPVPPPRMHANMKQMLKRTDAINPTNNIQQIPFYNLTVIMTSIIGFVFNTMDNTPWFDTNGSNVNTRNFFHELFNIIGNNRLSISYLTSKSQLIAEYVFKKIYNDRFLHKLNAFNSFLSKPENQDAIIFVSQKMESHSKTDSIIQQALDEYIKNEYKTKGINIAGLFMPIFSSQKLDLILHGVTHPKLLMNVYRAKNEFKTMMKTLHP